MQQALSLHLRNHTASIPNVPSTNHYASTCKKFFADSPAWPLLAALLLLATSTLPLAAQQPAEWTTPIAPFRIAGNLYYVGSKDLASYLVVTPAGDILINSSLEASVPLIQHSIEQLGLRFSDIKILLISHAHSDHAAGSAAILRLTHARYMVMDADVPVVESGGRSDFAYKTTYPPAHVDRVLHDNDQVRLGNATLTAHKTAGHTRGCTTWTLQVTDHGRRLNAVIVGGWYIPSDFRLVDSPTAKASYPGIAADLTHTFQLLHTLPCDLFLGAHGSYFNMLEKLAQTTKSSTPDTNSSTPGTSVWIDPTGYQQSLAERQLAFEELLHQQQQKAEQ